MLSLTNGVPVGGSHEPGLRALISIYRDFPRIRGPRSLVREDEKTNSNRSLIALYFILSLRTGTST